MLGKRGVVRKSKVRKRSKSSSAKTQRKLWLLCKQIIRKKYPNDCYTCEAKNLSGSNLHTGHMIPKATLGAFLKYDLRLLRPQCARCNIWGGGMGADFIKNMIIREGQDYVDSIFRDRALLVKSTDHYESLIPIYEQILEDLTANKP